MSLQNYTERELRDALGRFATGVAVITTRTDIGRVGITANSFASVSLDPPLVLWRPAKGSRRYTAFVEARRYAIHIMGEEQASLSQAFVSEGDAFGQHETREAEDGTPLIENCLARFHCETEAVHEAGDHAIIVGRVLDAQHRAGDPLIFSAGSYGSFAEGT